MFRIAKYMKKSWATILLIILLFVIQAYCDLTLPQYTSDIVDVGISQKGIDEQAPNYISENDLITIQGFYSDSDLEFIVNSYEKTDDTVDGEPVYEMTLTDEEDIINLESLVRKPIALLGIMSSFNSEDSSDADGEFEDMDVELLEQAMTQIFLPTTDSETRLELLNNIFDSFGELSDTMIGSLTAVYIGAEYESVGIDMGDYQTDYLLSMALKCLFFV